MSDLDVGDEIDALDETDEAGPGPSFTVTRPAPAGATDVTVIDLEDAGIDWPALVQAAVGARGVADFDHYRWSRAIDGCSARLLFAWLRAPLEVPRSGVDAVLDQICDNRLPWYPHHDDRPDGGLRAIWQALQVIDTDADDDWIQAVIDAAPELGCGDDPTDADLDASPFQWWPMTIELEHEPAHHRTRVHLHAANGRQLATTTVTDHRPAPDIPTNARGEPLATLDDVRNAQDPVAAAVAVAAEQYRRRRSGGKPMGRPPATSTIIANLTSRERLRVACEAVEQFQVTQAAVCRALSDDRHTVRTDSLNRALRRRRQRR